MATSFAEAQATILAAITPLAAEPVELSAAAGRVLAGAIVAPFNLPRFDNTAMDGFAVRSSDCRTGATLRLIGTLPAGACAQGVEVLPGTAVRIMTGAPLPAGADAVVVLEEAEATATAVRIIAPVTAGQHVRRRGEDVAAGTTVLHAGVRLRAAEISLLASFGLCTVAVHRRPRVAILSTGDELVELGNELGPGQIVNSNAPALAAAVHESGGEPWLLGIARDNSESLAEKIVEGFAADMLITTAGVSFGDHDLVRAVLADHGVEQRFWKIDIKPGRPTAFGQRGQLPVFSLPGNPVSALLVFETLVRPALRRLAGETQVVAASLRATLAEPFNKRPGRTQLLRVRVSREGDGLVARSAGDQNTGILRTLLRANGLAILPADWGEVAAGAVVDVHLFAELVGAEGCEWPVTGREG